MSAIIGLYQPSLNTHPAKIVDNPMNEADIKNRLAYLRDEINKNNHLYYVLDQPVLSDHEYDRMMIELLDIEHSNPELIREASQVAGSQSIVVSIDVKKTLLGKYEVYTENATCGTKMPPLDYARRMEDLGAGEIILCSIANEGTGKGYDLKLLNLVCSAVDVPVVALGGCGQLKDMADAVQIGSASAVAAGNLFVFHGKLKAVLITYPKYSELAEALGTRSYND